MNDYTNDIPKYRKKSSAKPPKKATHKHIYTACLLEYPENWWARLKPHEMGRYRPHLQFASYCPDCGKISSHDHNRWFKTIKKTYENGETSIKSVYTEEAERELNTTTRTLPVFKVSDPFVRRVENYEPDKSV